MATNTQRYTTVAMALHWITALLILYMLIWGEGLIKGEPWNKIPGSNPGLHASLGLLILILSFARLGWRLINPPPADVPMPAWQARLSHITHWAFYALLILVPVSGLAALDHSIADKHPEFVSLTFFNTFTIPHFTLNWFGELHDVFSKLVWALFALHVLAALKHQFVDKDGLLGRMLPH